MEYGVSHSFEDESIEAKARWFMQKSLVERFRQALQDMVFINKLIQFEILDDRSTFKTFRILEQKKS